MAPVFKRNLIWIWLDRERVVAVIGFSPDYFEKIFIFRDELCLFFQKSGSLCVHKIEGSPTESDSHIKFFSKDDYDRYKQFLLMKRPNFWHSLFNKQRFIEYKKHQKDFDELIKCEIETSHDFPCLIVQSRVYTEKELVGWFSDLSDKLRVPTQLSKTEKNIEDIILSNATFE